MLDGGLPWGRNELWFGPELARREGVAQAGGRAAVRRCGRHELGQVKWGPRSSGFLRLGEPVFPQISYVKYLLQIG